MKKSVILTIGVIYILAIVVVGFIGIRMKVYNANVYVESITCISDGYKAYEEGSLEKKDGIDGYIQVVYEEDLKVLLKCKINPENATEKRLDYVYDKSSSTYNLIKNDDGTAYVEFLKGGSATITIKSTDNGGKKLVVKIIAVDLGNIL